MREEAGRLPAFLFFQDEVLVMIKIFISHSSADVKLAEAIVELLRDSIGLNPNDIRCTSVDGYRLPAGANTESILREEVNSSEVFLALLSEASIKSTYVIFELGARWSSGKRLFPLLAPKLKPVALNGPITSLNCLSCTSAAQLHQLVSEIADDLKIQVNKPSVYQKRIDNILNYKEQENNESRKINADSIQKMDTKKYIDEHLRSESDLIKIIKEDARLAHPGDFSTQQYIVKEQITAMRAINGLNDTGIPEDILRDIKLNTATAHPNDFSTQLYIIREQIKAWKNLQ
ncbi:MAG: toll/interleukin-1 receptor domain-containing protein [Candidatus Electronema sp. VV]